MSNIVLVGFGNDGIDKHYVVDNITLAAIMSVDPALILGLSEITDDVTGGSLNPQYILGNGSIVDATFGNITPTHEFFTFSAEGWNLVKNISAVSIGSEKITFIANNFVHADLDFSGVSEDVILQVYNAKRGNLATGDGDDFIVVTSATNNTSWSNLHMISTGNGSDEVIIDAGSQNLKDTTIVDFIDGAFTKTEVFLGDGEDFFHTEGNVATRDRVSGGNDNDVVYSGSGDDYVSGDQGDDTLYGGDGNDTLKGQTENDKIFGENGEDILWGNDGNDVLYGGNNADWMKGGNGADGFILGAADTGIDTINDLRLSKGDYIQIKDVLGFDPLADMISDFVSIANSGADSLLSVDIDGSLNGQNFVQIAQISGITGLDANQLFADGDLVISNIII